MLVADRAVPHENGAESSRAPTRKSLTAGWLRPGACRADAFVVPPSLSKHLALVPCVA